MLKILFTLVMSAMLVLSVSAQTDSELGGVGGYNPNPEPPRKSPPVEPYNAFPPKQMPDGSWVQPMGSGTSGATSTKNLRPGVKLDIKAVNENVKVRMENAREEFKKDIEAKRVELKTRIETERQNLKTRLEKIKDERKKTAVERIDKNIADLNARITAHYVKVLDQIADVLARIVSRADKAEMNGREVTAVRAAIANAESVIAEARRAVTVQAGKAYALTITDDTKLKTDIGAVRKQLQEDLKAVEDKVKAAREAVRQAAVTLAKIPDIDRDQAATSTPSSTNN